MRAVTTGRPRSLRRAASSDDGTSPAGSATSGAMLDRGAVLVVGLLLSSSGTPIAPGAVASPTASLVAPATSSPTGTSGSGATPSSATVQRDRDPAGQPDASPPPPRAPGDYLLMTRAELHGAADERAGVGRRPRGRGGLRAWRGCATRTRHGVSDARRRRSSTPGPVTPTTGNGRATGSCRRSAPSARAPTTPSWRWAASSARTSSRPTSSTSSAPTTPASGPGWTDIRTRSLGGHGRWTTLGGTHEDSRQQLGLRSPAHRGSRRACTSATSRRRRPGRPGAARASSATATAWNRFQPVEGSA